MFPTKKTVLAHVRQCLILITILVSSFDLVVAESLEHPVSVIEADIYVNKFKTTMRLKCFAEDLELLQGVEALDDGFYETEELREATQDHAKFLAERIHLIGADGNKFAANIIEVKDFEIPEGRVRQGELMKHTIGIVLEFKYDKAPEFLTINQQVIADGLLLPSELKILIKQAGSDEPFFHMMKPDQPETFRFDWSKPAPASDASEEAWSSWFNEQREKTLGIASYSSVYSFIYITNYEVRHEVLIPLATLNTFFEIERDDPAFLNIAEQDRASEKVKRLFSIGNPVTIDNIEVTPVFDRIDFYGLDLRDFAVQAERRKVSMANGRVGIIMSYSTKGIPRDVKVTWDKFNDNLKTVDSIVFAFDETSKAEFSMFQEDNTFKWNSQDRKPPVPISDVGIRKSHLYQPQISIPILSVALGLLSLPFVVAIPFSQRLGSSALIATILVGGSFLFIKNGPKFETDKPFTDPVVRIDEENAADIFEQLHKNMFRAFDYHSESEIYDALARSVDGDLLQELYLKIIDSLRVSEQGGAVSKVEEVNLVSGKQLNPAQTSSASPSFEFQSRWELIGTVEHWGHIHQRTNKYEADFQIELIDEDWKITEMKIQDFEHGKVKTNVRKL